MLMGGRLLLQGIVLLASLTISQAKLIRPILHSCVSLSTSNPQLQTVYNFTFTLPSGLPIDGKILIQFPE